MNGENILPLLARALAPVKRGLSMMLARGVLQRANAGGKLQTVQVSLLADEIKDGVELFEPYGLTSHALPGAETVVGFLGGDRSHGIALVMTDRRHRPTDLAAGEVAVFTHEDADGGHRLHLGNGRAVTLAGDKVEIRADSELVLKIGRSSMSLSDSSITIKSPKIYTQEI